MPNAIGQRPATVYDPTINKAGEVSVPAKNPNDIQIPPPAEKKEGSGALLKTMTGLAIIGSAAYLLYNLRKSGNMLKTLENFKAQGGKIEKGVAKNKDGSLFEGLLTYKDKDGNVFINTYANGNLIRASKNAFEVSKINTDKIPNYVKEYTYTTEGKLKSIQYKTIENGVEKVEILTPRRDIKTVGEGFKKVDTFGSEGYTFVDGKPVKADGTPFSGVIAEKLENDVMLREFKDGELISERLGTTLKDNKYKKASESYVMDKDDLLERRNDFVEKVTKKEEDKIIELLKKEDAETEERMRKEKIGDLVDAIRTKKEDDEILELLELEDMIAADEKAKKEAIVNMVEALGQSAKKKEDAKPINQVKKFFSGLFKN